MRKKEDKTIYKLYRDIQKEYDFEYPIKVISLGIGTGLGTFAGHYIGPNQRTLILAGVGATIGFLGNGIYNYLRIHKNKKEQDLSIERFEVFKEEAKKIIGKEDVSLDKDNVYFTIMLPFPEKVDMYSVKYKDDSCLVEKYQNDELLECLYYSDMEKMAECIDGIDLSPALSKAYEVTPRKHTKKTSKQSK
jgi:hypothetical protein